MKNLFFLCGLIFFLCVFQIPPVCFAQNPLFSHIKKTIVLDPGHGGADLGAKGSNGLVEKEVVFYFAKALGESLKKTYNVVLTRSDDYFLDIPNRTETANQSDADLFISLHTGASSSRECQCIGIYYYEQTENVGQETTSTQRGTEGLWHQEQLKYAPASRDLAQSLSGHLSGITRVEGLPAKVLAAAAMPAILIELGHITSPFDEKRLANPSYTAALSQDIQAAIDAYLIHNSKKLSQ